ncbi:DUF1501 domain-containing protein [Chitinophaga flava]|uniref:Twin-arginine translocation pathway signal n=1 Tax=Chitinophaga flava TaxID=2259036 RepID=A0A365Y5Y6_9BACT|nr:DUF1501 domain-containing protein [Chitinophaga flava]RBL93993.1 hypothetical protein DF182_16050 [Chitinophaga flava]
MKRRDFLKQSGMASGMMLLPAFVHAAMAKTSQPATRRVVFIQLMGGNDGLNTVIPYRQEMYYQQRPQLAIPAEEVLPVTAEWGFNPALRALLPFYEKQQLLVLQQVGYPDTDTSHYHSSQIWRTGCLQGLEANHWLPATIPATDLGTADFGPTLEHIASQIGKGDPTQVYHLALDGFDTHQFQRVQQDQLLATYAQGVSTFLHALRRNGQLDNTLVVTWSEFGRSVSQNIRQGTDHGHGNQVYIFGSRLRQWGIQPCTLTGGELPVRTDFRSLYATIGNKWLGVTNTTDVHNELLIV